MKAIWIDTSKRLALIEATLMQQLETSPACDLTPRQVHVLSALYEQDSQHASDIAKKIGMVATSFTPVLDALERMNLIQRMPDPHDRRAILISLTRAAQDLEHYIIDALREVEITLNKKR